VPSTIVLLLLVPTVTVAAVVLFLVYLVLKYTPIIGRVFEEKPMLLPLRLPPLAEGEEVRFPTADGLELAGSYLRARTERRTGVLVFCHEFLSDRWSCQPYVEPLRDIGYDVFTFDFRNHGSSAHEPGYSPLQWVSDHEVRDLEAALAYLRGRPDRDPAGFGLFGVSRGGGTGLVVTAEHPDVWAIVTDGAFPTRGTMLPYILRWAQIFVQSSLLYAAIRDYAPLHLFEFLGSLARHRAERRLGCKFPDIETAVARLAPRPWLMIHGGKDTYIGPEIARQLFELAEEPKDLWIVPGAKHNRCREVDAQVYASRVEAFFRSAGPRGPLAPVPAPTPAPAPGIEPAPATESTETPDARVPMAARIATIAAPGSVLSKGMAASVSLGTAQSG
jgi:pimeloyl-ACP methyl ester carboxylesterase